MKCYEFLLSSNLLKTFFPEKRIKSKTDILEILMEATRYMLVNRHVDKDRVAGKIILYVDKMSRIFIVSNNKYYSIVFPFSVKNQDEILKFTYKGSIDIDSSLISNFISIIKSESFNAKNILDFAYSILEIETDDNFWILLKEIFLMEDGYVRYDYDDINFQQAKKNGHQDKHPLFHYDLFYSSNATLKIGLNKKLHEKDFIDFFDITTKCKFLQ